MQEWMKMRRYPLASWFPTLISCSPNLPRVYIRLWNHFIFVISTCTKCVYNLFLVYNYRKKYGWIAFFLNVSVYLIFLLPLTALAILVRANMEDFCEANTTVIVADPQVIRSDSLLSSFTYTFNIYSDFYFNFYLHDSHATDIILYQALDNWLWIDLTWMVGRAWLAQLVRSLPSDHKVPGSIPSFAEIRTFVQPSFPPKPTQLSILPG